MSSDCPPSAGSEEFDDDSVSMWQVDEASMTSTDAGEDAALAEAAQVAARAEFGDIDAELSDMERVAGSAQLPTLAILGRPNVGKSTLVNRILGRREAVVEDVPGVTRDRVSYDAEWNGKHFLVMDTGGWDTRARGLGAQIAAQAKRALTEADAVAFVLDATVGATDADTEVARVLQRAVGAGDQVPADGERIPLLSDVYRLVKEKTKPGFRLYVELKTSLLDLSQSADPVELADAAVALTRDHELDETVTFVSFDWRALARAKEKAPHILNAFTTLPFFQLDPADASAARDVPGSEDDLIRKASAAGAPWAAGFDWRNEKGATFAERMLKAIASGPADGWFSWHGDVTPETAAKAKELLC